MYGIDEIITDNLELLNERLSEVFNKYGLKHNLEVSDYEYQFHSREEWILIPEKHFNQLFGSLHGVYEFEDDFNFEDYLPRSFGVYRGYAGGGVHSGLIQSEFHKLSEFLEKHGFEKADDFLQEVLEEFRKTFWKIHKDIDSYIEEETGEEVPVWESSSL